MTAKDMFDELVFISESQKGEFLVFHKDKLQVLLMEMHKQLQNTVPNSESYSIDIIQKTFSRIGLQPRIKEQMIRHLKNENMS